MEQLEGCQGVWKLFPKESRKEKPYFAGKKTSSALGNKKSGPDDLKNAQLKNSSLQGRLQKPHIKPAYIFDYNKDMKGIAKADQYLL